MFKPSPKSTDPSELVVGGITPLTMIDYPDHLSAVIYCQGCPLKCDYCHNSEFIPREATNPIPWHEITTFLDQRRGLLDGVVFSGGEPTLQAALPAAVKNIKKMGFLVGLHSAGPYPQRFAELLPLVDWVGLDIKALAEDYAALTGSPKSGRAAWQCAEMLIESGIPHQIRTTLHPLNSSPDKQKTLIKRLSTVGKTDHKWQTCRPSDGQNTRRDFPGF
ncbi:MAG: anaerobic ribonucleoside-triphosphate reductase activating protein [Candidatus Thiodiazotropha weberae]|uniref:Anaerobic ribonucleoside-triphosphate reductase activating protein n=1 Tax=Candidatus Thiodiazotropha endoloripes TaxID=1818881 RepID=A0A1E2ULF3_9GAMM|nr:anaerobic ribonucleoside-triphosphate reductase activating protein [Candidatus Thiodiazotropha endoloripes]MCG7898273.1 anaerobic ribonucleoside-triphosphate reductase activating protein [Candidatus Thiodiazotropha weberae]MCG7903370.1 anaerobic ribonucleoside-triphosphate reductase activating protein [Candidatus Thiodiazotropha weberae]MCG7915332.1 anaerobic ribonucleoside-triphosphate reductase activating protein [Candidatus Thiodiazotropha weberae]ODB94088.1 anaerobic ribonucleoside-triph